MKKIIFFSKNLNIGGMEKALINLLNNISNFYDITLILEEKEGILLNDLDKRINVAEYRISKIKNPLIRKMYNMLKRFKWYLRYHNKFDFSCNFATYSFIGSRLAQIASENSSLYVHSDYYNFFKRDAIQTKKFFLAHKIDRFLNLIFVSNESKENIRALFPDLSDRFTVINNIVNASEIKELADKHIENEEKIFQASSLNFVYIGRLDNSSKNFDLMLESFKQAIVLKPNIRLFLVGNGQYYNNIMRFIEKNNLEGKICLLGEKKNPYPYMRLCDCLIFTSYYEGFPVTYCEALVLNKQVITTVAVKDGILDIRDYFDIVHMNKEEIVGKILKINKLKCDYNIDFEIINNCNIERIRAIIEKRSGDND